MSKPTIRELLDGLKNASAANLVAERTDQLAERVEAALRWCRNDMALWKVDLEHSDSTVRAMARGRISASEQVLRALEGKESR